MGFDSIVAVGVETVLARAFQVFLALAGAYLVALWFVLIVWTYRDIETRSRNVLTQILATLLVLLFWVPGVLLYLILRPKESLDSAYQRSLEEEYLLQDLEELPLCSTCEQFVEPDFLLCPHCHTRLREPCLACARLIDLRWSVCPYCAAAQGGEAAEVPVQVEAPAARWRATLRRSRPDPEPAEAATPAQQTIGEDETPAVRESPEPAAALVTATTLDVAVAVSEVREPIPLAPTPHARFRRVGGGGRSSIAGEPPTQELADHVPAGGLLTSILGSRNGSGTRARPPSRSTDGEPGSDAQPNRPEQASTRNRVDVTSTETPESSDQTSQSTGSQPMEKHVSEPEVEDLVTARADGNGD